MLVQKLIIKHCDTFTPFLCALLEGERIPFTQHLDDLEYSTSEWLSTVARSNFNLSNDSLHCSSILSSIAYKTPETSIKNSLPFLQTCGVFDNVLGISAVTSQELPGLQRSADQDIVGPGSHNSYRVELNIMAEVRAYFQIACKVGLGFHFPR